MTADRAQLTSALLQASLRVRQVADDGTDDQLHLALNEVRSSANRIEATLPAVEAVEQRVVAGAARLSSAIEGRRLDDARRRLNELLEVVHAVERELYQPEEATS
jgi:hypothetical protein